MLLTQSSTTGGFDSEWPSRRRDEAWAKEMGRRGARQLDWLLPATAGIALALLALDFVLKAPLLLSVSRAILLAGAPIVWLLRRRKHPLSAMRTHVFVLMLAGLALIAFVLADGRRAEPYLAVCLVALVSSPVGLHWTAAAAAMLGVGSVLVAPSDVWLGHYINAVVFPAAGLVARRYIDNLARDAFEARLRVEWARERERRLLNDLLPRAVADELLERGEVAPRVVDATVVFLDVVGFSQAAKTVAPVQLLETLNQLFSSFDAVVERHGLVKLKTMGDGYLLAGGLLASDLQLEPTLNATLELIAASQAHSGALGENVRVRIGVHVGPVVAGVIGRNRPNFDIWGDTVNVAARVEQLGEPGAVVVSADVVRRLPAAFEVDDVGPRTAKHGLQLHLYRLRKRAAGEGASADAARAAEVKIAT